MDTNSPPTLRPISMVLPAASAMRLAVSIDPQTVEQIIQIGMYIAALFHKDDKNVGNDRWRSALSEQLNRIEGSLSIIMRMLGDLGHVIKDEHRKDAEKGLAAFSAPILINLPHWKKNIQDTSVKAAAFTTLATLQQQRQVCVYYGPASVLTVALAMRYEFALLDLLAYEHDGWRETVKQYLTYYDECCDPKLDSSFSSHLVKRKLENQKREVEYPNCNSETRHAGTHYYESRGMLCSREMSFVISGSLSNGFTGELVFGHEKCESKFDNFPRDGHRDPMGDTKSISLVDFNAKLGEYLAGLNGASNDYKDNQHRIAMLESQIEQITIFRDICVQKLKELDDHTN